MQRPTPDAVRVVGFRVCANPECDNLVLEGVAHKTGGFCEPCCREGLAEALQTVEIAVGGRRFSRSVAKKPNSARNRRQLLRRKADLAWKSRKHAQDHAKRAAMKRLRAVAPELYDLILADERYKRGLTPFPVEKTKLPGSGLQGWETLSAVAFYHALADPGAVHGPEDPNPQP